MCNNQTIYVHWSKEEIKIMHPANRLKFVLMFVDLLPLSFKFCDYRAAGKSLFFLFLINPTGPLALNFMVVPLTAILY